MIYRDFIISDIVQENEEVCSYYLKPLDKDGISYFASGQYITVKFITMNASVIRCYSLSDCWNKDFYRITVKHDKAHLPSIWAQYNRIGMKLQVSEPQGSFCLPETISRNVVLISSGIGITPTISMLNHLISLERLDVEVFFIHISKNMQHLIMHDYFCNVMKCNSKLHYHVLLREYSNATDLPININNAKLTADLLREILINLDNEYYFCGSKVFMSEIYRILVDLGVQQVNMHYEFFDPLIK